MRVVFRVDETIITAKLSSIRWCGGVRRLTEPVGGQTTTGSARCRLLASQARVDPMNRAGIPRQLKGLANTAGANLQSVYERMSCAARAREKPMSGISPIASAMQQIQQMATQAAGGDGPDMNTIAESGASSGEFASLLQNSLKKVSARQAHGTAEAHAFELGAPNVALNDVMIDLQKANIAFQEAVEVRNKLATAYTTIMQMSV
jgi:flagellar hook-basal body complex protein FliE